MKSEVEALETNQINKSIYFTSMSFTHLHVHSVHSLYHSALKVEDAVDEAIRLGMNALAITDYDSLYAAHDFVQYARSISPDFKPIVGCELHVTALKDVANKKPLSKAPHITILCKNEIGYKNLCKLLDIAWNEGFHICPSVSFEQLAEHKDGLIALSGCLGCEVAKHFMRGNFDAAEEAILKYHEQFGEDYYLELIRSGFNERIESTYTDFLLNMGRKHGIKVVATNDVHRCLSVDNAKVKRLVESNLGDFAKNLPLPTDDWLKSEAEMLSKFADCPEAIYITGEIVDKIENYVVPQWELPSSRWKQDDYLKTLGDCLRIIE